jgi:hypothetical protein
MENQYKVLVHRYKTILNHFRPDVVAEKNPEGSLELSHIKWMLEKMESNNFVPLTSYDAWLSWVQASLYHNGILHIRHEIDITREILKENNK